MYVLIIIAAWRSPDLHRGQFAWRPLLRATVGALPGLAMPLLVLGGLYGGLFTPTEAAAAACAYALLYGLVTGREEFIRNLLPTAARAMNLTAVVFFLVGSVGIFQFVAANQAWPQHLAQLVIEMQLEPPPVPVRLSGLLLVLGTFSTASP